MAHRQTIKPFVVEASPPGRFVVALVVLIAVLLGGGWLAAKVAVSEIPPFTLAAMRFTVAGAILFAFSWARGERASRKNLAPLLVAAFVGIFLGHAFLYVGLRITPVSVSALLTTGLGPIFGVSLAAILVGERPTRGVGAALILGLVGAAAMIPWTPGSLQGDGQGTMVGAALIACGVACSAAFGALSLRLLWRMPTLAVASWVSLLGGMMFIPFAIAESGLRGAGGWSLAAWAAVVYLTIPSAVVATVAYLSLVRRNGAIRGGLVNYIPPAVGLMLGAWVLNERVELLQLLGATLAVYGGTLAVKGHPGMAQPPQ